MNADLFEILAHLDGGGRIHPRDLARAIKKVDPDFRIGDAAGKSGVSPEADWEKQRLEREKGIKIVQDAIRKTPEPSESMLRHLGLTAEQYKEMRLQLFSK